ncbi:MAG: hypothetical protein V4511_07055 [Bacteroidota bacterium]
MHQLLVNIKDDSKMDILLNFLKSLNYISVKELSDNDIIVSEAEKNVMRERVKKAKPENFKNWDDIKNSFKLD